MTAKGLKSFLLSFLVIGFIWLVVLPWMANRGPIRRMIDRNQRIGIDPSALFYSDLEHLTYRRGVLQRADSDR